MRRLVPLLSVLFALGVGIALGAGPLDDDSGSAAPTAHARPRSASTFDETFVASVAPTLYAHRLAGQSVAVVTTPGASAQTVKALVDQIVAAGGTVASRTDLTDALTAPGQKTLVDTMGSQLAGQLAQQAPTVADASLSTYPRMGRLLGLALATTGAPAAAGAPASIVRESLGAAELASGPAAGAAEPGVAPLVAVILGHDLDDAIVDGLVQGLADQAHGVVVAGRTHSSDIGSVRERTKAVATVDGVETGAGRAAAVLALVRQVTGGGGSFGASGVDGAAPVG
jgi:hypothetical protein